MNALFRTGRFWAVIATLAAMFYGFSGMYGRAMSAFRAPEEDMDFAWFVPLFSLYILWSQRDKLLDALTSKESRPSWTGLLLCLPCIALALLGARGLQLRFEQLGFIGLLIFLPWAFYGRRAASVMLFPALYLCFTIPVSALVEMFTLHLRLLASGTALAVLNGIGIDAVREGTAIMSQGAHPFNIDVAEPCSGLRSLMALMALTAAYAWFNQPTWTRRILLFATSVPLAILGNITRILTICIVAVCANSDFALGFYHDYSGYIVFIVAIALMVAVGELITRLCDWMKWTHPLQKPEKDKAVQGQTIESASRSTSFLPYVAAPLFAAVFMFQALTPASKIMEAPEGSLPELLGYTSDEVCYCQNEACGRLCFKKDLKGESVCPTCGAEMKDASLGELTVLPSDTRFVKRVYRSADGCEYLVGIVIGGVSKRSIHRPELCLPGQGWTLMEPHDIEVAGRPYRVLKVMPPNGGAPRMMAYTFFNQEGMRTSSHIRRIFADTWDRSVFNRVDRWVMVTVHAVRAQSPRGLDIVFPADRMQLEMFLSRLSEVLP